ncbi:OmpA family protein [Thermaurantimonas sp.]|uniref:OmpA family protein n=1 Tax=Thermaurantimonas sp. TaxID=2681568 RepID=UPI0039199454
MLTLVNISEAQNKKALKMYQQAREKLANRDIQGALKQLGELNKKYPDFPDAWILKGDLHAREKNTDLALEAYMGALKAGAGAFLHLSVAELYFNKYQYDLAKKHLDIYQAYPKASPQGLQKANKLRKNIEFASVAIKDSVRFSPENLGPTVNDRHHQYFPALSADGKLLVFTEREVGTDKKDEDFYYAELLKGGGFSPKRKLPGYINTPLNEGAQSVSADGRIIIFTGCHRPEGFGSCDLYASYLMPDGSWSSPQNLGPAINTAAWESQPSLSPDGRTLYFVRGKTGRDESTDIYYSTLDDNRRWTEAKPLPGAVNTPGREATPFIYFDNQTLFFASDEHPGFGDMDFFYSKLNADGTWSQPVNLGYPVNTSSEEFSLIISPDGRTAYFASDSRADGYGGFDLYKFSLDERIRQTPVAFVNGVAIDANDGKRIANGSIRLFDLSSSKEIWTGETRKDGTFFWVLPGNREYAMYVEKEGYLFHSQNFVVKEEPSDSALYVEVRLKPIETGSVIVLQNLFFDTDSYKIQPKSEAELAKILQFLKQNPNVRVEIAGHTDSRGSAAYNRALSQNRAKSVIEYLVKNGINPVRLIAKGYGDTQPVASNDTDEGRQLNRRTELKIIATQ